MKGLNKADDTHKGDGLKKAFKNYDDSKVTRSLTKKYEG